MQSGPREIVTPFRQIPLEVPEGMKPNEFFNSAENLADLVHNNGLLQNPEGLLLYRKALGHSNEFDLDHLQHLAAHPRPPGPAGAPHPGARAGEERLEPHERGHPFLHAGAAIPTRTPPGAGRRGQPRRHLAADFARVPSIRMLHNHFIVFDKAELRDAPLADASNPNLTDGGQHSLFQAHMRDAYRAFFAELDLRILEALRSPAPAASPSPAIRRACPAGR
jgi:hypothetical protein